MARYPTFDEYTKRGNYQDGIKKCDDLLKRNAKDPQLLIVKLELVYAAGQDAGPILDQLATIQLSSTLDVWGIANIEQIVVKSLKDVYPLPSTAGPAVTKLWDNAFKSAANAKYKLEILEIRFAQAIRDNRLLDAQQALIQLKAFQPKARVWYMAHAAITQLLSSSNDDLQSRLAISLARKAVNDHFDDDKTLDCRVPGQIFALQRSSKDLESIAGKSFAESKQVFDAQRTNIGNLPSHSNGHVNIDPSTSTPKDWFIGEVTVLERISKDMINQSASEDLLLNFISNAVRLYNHGVTTLGVSFSRASTNACFLAISALVKMFVTTNKRVCLVYGALLGEDLLKQNPHVHEARLILVYLYVRLGFGTLAIAMFESLNVKEIQHDTVGHAMLTHISYLHPAPAHLSSKNTYDIHERTAKALSMYVRHEDKLVETETGILRHGQTGMLFDLQLLRDELRKSLVRRLFLLEHRRVSRLTGKPIAKIASDAGPKVTVNWITTVDNRDFNATFDYGFNVEKVLYVWGDTVSDAKWGILNRLLIDSIWALSDKRPLLVNDIDILLKETEESAETMRVSDGLRKLEYLAVRVAISLGKLLTKVAAKLSPSPNEFDTVISDIEHFNIDLLTSTTGITTEYLVDHNIYLDIFRIIKQACRYIEDTLSSPPNKLKDLDTIAQESISKLTTHARMRAVAIKASDIKDELFTMNEFHEGLGLLGDEEVSRFCQSVAESAKEGWNGIVSSALAK